MRVNQITVKRTGENQSLFSLYITINFVDYNWFSYHRKEQASKKLFLLLAIICSLYYEHFYSSYSGRNTITDCLILGKKLTNLICK